MSQVVLDEAVAPSRVKAFARGAAWIMLALCLLILGGVFAVALRVRALDQRTSQAQAAARTDGLTRAEAYVSAVLAKLQHGPAAVTALGLGSVTDVNVALAGRVATLTFVTNTYYSAQLLFGGGTEVESDCYSVSIELTARALHQPLTRIDCADAPLPDDPDAVITP